jgi:hypothetical protein
MGYRRLGQAGLHVSEICLGTRQFKWTTDETTAYAVLDAFAEDGGNFLDTADIYPRRAEGLQGSEAEDDWVFLADADFDGRAVTERDLIPPIRRGGKLVAPERKAPADRVAQARLDGLFGQRWKTETVPSVIKRKFGGDIRSRLKERQNRETLIKAVVYNLHR